jgi:hypothetical protein
MFGFRSGAHTLRAGAGIALSCVVACGGAEDTPYYGTPVAPEGAASSGALSSNGGDTSAGTGGTSLDVAGTSARGGADAASAGSGTGPSSGGASSTGTGGMLAGTGAGGARVATAGSAASTADGGEPGGGEGGASEAGAGGEASVPEVDCTPRGALARPFDGHCYELESAIETFDDAASDCEARGAHLVTISSEGRSLAQFLAENAFVWQLAGSVQSWIGATDGRGPHQAGDGSYSRWITGEPMTFDNWSSGQPNNSRASCQDGIPCSCDKSACYEHCGFLWDTPGKQMDAVPGWNDRVCDNQLPYVCEWDG